MIWIVRVDADGNHHVDVADDVDDADADDDVAGDDDDDDVAGDDDDAGGDDDDADVGTCLPAWLIVIFARWTFLPLLLSLEKNKDYDDDDY